MDGANFDRDYPVVLRFAGLYPHQLAGYEAHRLRKGGDLSHVDRSRSKLNGPPLIGPEDWAELALAEIRDMTTENFAAELEALEKRKRKKDIERRMVEGPKQPWRATRHGPMREVILTANKEWFDADMSSFLGESGNQREEEFEKLAVSWLKHHFADNVIHARADRDEMAYHIHAVIMPRATVEIAKPKAKVPTATATRRMLQPSIHPMIKDYEAAQDSVGRWFAPLGLVRGERTAAAIEAARENGDEPPKRRYHAKTSDWRAQEEARLRAKADDLEQDRKALETRTARVEAREAEAETVLAVAEGVGDGRFAVDQDAETPALIEASKDKDNSSSERELAALEDRSPRGFTRAAIVFGRAWTRMFGDARTKAETEAQAGVATAVADIAEADEKIAQAVLHLPRETRTAITKIRATIPAILWRLKRRSGTGAEAVPDGQDRRERPENGEKF
ncbi:plasmid recombination protein [Palleronia sp.]|uniref:plasmid recombination protein n=1 Tax=Palleronia sp. TaxID=1940284 RepID=UPI0035C8084A